jgi:type 1 glutamine amidotransferase
MAPDRILPSIAALGIAACGGAGRAPDAPDDERPLRLLAFTRTEGYRHGSIPAARQALAALASENRWSLRFEEAAESVRGDVLAGTDVVVFLLTTGDVLDPPAEAALEAFVRDGGGFVGVHSASDTEYDWPFYGELVGAYFASHPAVQPATVRVERPAHPAAAGLPSSWRRTDEWYDFRARPLAPVDVVLSVDESTYTGGAMGPDHPIAWGRAIGRGRSFYTALGHTDESYAEPAFLAHLAGAIRWAGGRAP